MYTYIYKYIGEEEAIYSWAAINFLKGDLLSESKGIGTANGGIFSYICVCIYSYIHK
jgi:hypothetical protein